MAEFTYVDRAAEMAEFTTGRVKPVSVLKATGANVVVFAFEPGTGLPDHTAQQPVLLQALEGKLTVQIERPDHYVGAGRSAAYRAGSATQRISG